MAKKEVQVRDMFEGCIGHHAKQSVVVDFITRVCEDNFTHERNGEKRFSGNVWGSSGTSKSAIIESFKNRPVEYCGKKYEGYDVRSIPIAQFEEMGDILGVPDEHIQMTKDAQTRFVPAKNSVIDYYIKMGWGVSDPPKVITKTAKPDWVPTEARPGILHFEDGNRASVRILKGLMQVVQDYRTVEWEIPKGWTIVFSGNPDSQQYIVTSQDSAMLTRQKHITMEPDVKEWAVWAQGAGVDPRGISFLLRYPEMIYGERTNLRTLTEFFHCLKRHKKVDGVSKFEIQVDGSSLLDAITLEAFFVFATRDMRLVIEPEQILCGYDQCKKEFAELMADEKDPRVDIISVTCERLLAYMTSSDYEPSRDGSHKTNFQKFLLDPSIPKSLIHSLMRRTNSNPKVKHYLQGNAEILKEVAATLRVAR